MEIYGRPKKEILLVVFMLMGKIKKFFKKQIEKNEEINTSVIINSWRGTEKYLPECIDSVMSQTKKPYEIIVVIDGYEKPMTYDGTITIVRNENRGVAYSRHQGVKISTGNWLLFVDADDVLPENYIDEIEAVARWKNCDVIYPNCVLWSKWGDSKHENVYWKPPNPLTIKDMTKQNYVVVSSLMKKKVYDSIKGFNPDLNIFEDYEFFLKAFCMKFKFHPTSAYLKYRQRTNSRNRTFSKDKKRVYEIIKKRVFKEFDIL
jgi:glycosyltransferase involved in cell wall biosynthesis